MNPLYLQNQNYLRMDLMAVHRELVADAERTRGLGTPDGIALRRDRRAAPAQWVTRQEQRQHGGGEFSA